MSEVGDVTALWKRVEAWPGELKQALIAQVNAQAKVDELQRQLDRARGYDSEGDELDAVGPRRAILGSYGGLSDDAAQQRRRLDRVRQELQEARDQARVRILNDYKSRNERLPAQAFVQSLVEADADVTAKREAFKKAEDEYDMARRPPRPFSMATELEPDQQAESAESEEVRRLEREVAAAEVAAELAEVEVKHQRAIGRSLAMLVRLST